MTRYIYDGPGTRLVLAGQTLVRGRAVELDGRAAAAADNHPGIRQLKATKAKSADSAPNQGGDALAARRALVARAKELGIPATGKSEALSAAIAKAEAAASGGGAE